LNEVFIDENCKLCSSFGSWVDNRNHTIKISNQKNLDNDLQSLDSLIFKDQVNTFIYSDAVIMTIYSLGGLYKSVLILKIIPKFIRDKVYKIIAKYRNKFIF